MQVEKTIEDFPYEYVGGGYFREKGVQKGVSADIIHGMEAIKFALEWAREEPASEVENE